MQQAGAAAGAEDAAMAAGAGTGVPVRRGPSLFLCCRGEVGDYERSARRARRLQRRDQGGRPAVPSPWCRGSNSPSPDTRGARCEPVSPRRVRTTTTMRPESCATPCFSSRICSKFEISLFWAWDTKSRNHPGAFARFARLRAQHRPARHAAPSPAAAASQRADRRAGQARACAGRRRV